MAVQHLLTSLNSRFYATVYSTASFSSVVSNRSSFAVTYSVYAISFNAILVNQYCTNSVCTTLGQLLVVGVRTNGVSVTFHGGAGLWVLLHEVSQVFDVAVAVLLHVSLVEVKFHVQFNANSFSNNYAAISINGGVGFGAWALVQVVAHAVAVFVVADFSSNNWSWLSFLGAATEVGADAQTSGHFSFVRVVVVHRVNSSLGENVLGEVVLHASAHVSEGAVVTAGTIRNVADVLVSEASRHERTQAYAWGTEVVHGIKGSQVAFDVFVAGVIFRTHVVVFAVRQRQLHVISQEVTNRTTEQVAVAQITGAVGDVTLTESIHLDCALALSQCADGSGSNESANDYA